MSSSKQSWVLGWEEMIKGLENGKTQNKAWAHSGDVLRAMQDLLTWHYVGALALIQRRQSLLLMYCKGKVDTGA